MFALLLSKDAAISPTLNSARVYRWYPLPPTIWNVHSMKYMLWLSRSTNYFQPNIFRAGSHHVNVVRGNESIYTCLLFFLQIWVKKDGGCGRFIDNCWQTTTLLIVSGSSSIFSLYLSNFLYIWIDHHNQFQCTIYIFFF